MNTTSFSAILISLIIIVGGYLVFSDSVQGRAKLILIVFVGILGIYLLVNLPIFKSYTEILDSPKPATTPTIVQGSKLPVSSTAYSISTWIYVTDWNYGFGKQKTILQMPRSTDTPMNLSLDSYDNNLIITYPVNTNSKPVKETITVHNINIQKWVNIIVCFDSNKTDTYINGKLVDSHINSGVIYTPITQTDLTVGSASGFSGSISNTRYYSKVLSPQEVWNIYRAGFSSNLLGNFLNRYNASFTFYQDQQVVGEPIYIM
jgi:hypothetical protein